MDKKKSKKFNKIWLLSIIVMTFFVGIGYAQLTSNTLDVTGKMTSSETAELYISDITNTSNIDADLDNSKVNNYYQTLMTGKVTLSDTNVSSSITYQVTITNNSNMIYAFKEVVVDSSFYDNTNITYTLDGIDAQTKIKANSSITFNITFSYLNGTLADSNILNYTIQFKFSSNAATDVILSLAEGADDTSTDVITLDSSDSSCTNTLAYDGTSDKNLRYVGNNPCNYVTFNNETYRIIGVMNNIDDGTGKTETRLKIVATTSAGNYGFDYKGYGIGSRTIANTTYYGSNDWSDSQLMMLLNTSTSYNLPDGYERSNTGLVTDSNGYIVYQEGCAPASIDSDDTEYTCTTANFTLNDTAKSMISDAVWKLGGSSNHKDATAATFYTRERETTVYSGHATSWTGKVGLIYPSDYGYATSGGTTTSRSACLSKYIYNYTASDCYNNDWLYPGNYTNTWTITPGSGADRAVYLIYYNGRISWAYASKTTYDGSNGSALKNSDVFPALYLSSDVLITSGNGSSSNPYVLSMN